MKEISSMKDLNFENSSNRIVKTLEIILSVGQSFGLSLSSASAKLESIKRVIADKNIKIALIGRFSDGKTSILAGMLGKKFENMIIGIDETSDELQEYKFDGIGEGFEFVDTPGLFGTKDKEIDGENIRISTKTEKYLSQAHIIVYVCDAKTPIKNTHEEIIFNVLRKYNKLGVTIFVLNKMDDVCEIEDEVDYQYNSEIKKQWLIDGLKRAINLTSDEEKSIQAICVSADPGRLGLDYWLAKGNYEDISRIGLLRTRIMSLVKSANEEELRNANLRSVAMDFIDQVSRVSEAEINPKEDELAKAEETNIVVQGDFDAVTMSLITKRQDIRNALTDERNHYYAIVEDATLDTIDEVLFKYFGTINENGNFGVLDSNIDSLFEGILGSSKDLEVRCKNNVELLNKEAGFFDDILDKYGSKIGGLKVDNRMVKAGRDVVAPNVKLKPWGAVKIADKINIGIAGVGLLLEVRNYWKKRKAEKELEELKRQLKDYLGAYFNALNAFVKDDQKFYSLFPAYIYLAKKLKDKDSDLQACKAELAKLRDYQERVHSMLEHDIVDAEFENIK